MFTLDGTAVQKLQLPGIGHSVWSHSSQNDKDVFFTYNQFTRPPSILRFNVATMQLSGFRSAKLSYDPAPFDVRQLFYKSKDGTRIPMFSSTGKISGWTAGTPRFFTATAASTSR